MSQHTLTSRTEAEVTWFQRRSFVQAAAVWVGAGGFAAAHAQMRTNIVDQRGDVLINGRPLVQGQTIQTGDQLQTGPGGNLVFVVGNAAFQVRQNSRFAVERGDTINVVSVLRLLTGAVVSVWGKGHSRRITTPTLTAGIRGTGVYTEVASEQANRTYFCNCYGEVDLTSGTQTVASKASYHQAFWTESEPKNGRLLTPAGAINHTDEELETLAKLIDQRTNWQVMGKKGVKDGKGQMEEGKSHPADNYFVGG